MSNTINDYDVVIRRDDHSFVAYLPAIPGCHAMGATVDEARAELEGVIEMIAEEFSEEGKALPDRSR